MERFTSNIFVWNVSNTDNSILNKSINEKANKFSKLNTEQNHDEDGNGFICVNVNL